MTRVKEKVKAIIFDMDGTIIDTEHVWKNVTLDLLEREGVGPLCEDGKNFLKSLSGVGLSHSTQALKQRFNLTREVEELIQHKLEIANEHLARNINFIEGFEVFHQKLRDHNIPSSIATNAHPKNLEGLVERLNFKKYFGENIYCIGHVNFIPKPNPDLFLHAAKQLGVKPEECVVFEDSLPGFQAAQAAGMKCIAIKNELNKSLLDQVHDSIKTYHEAVEALRKI